MRLLHPFPSQATEAEIADSMKRPAHPVEPPAKRTRRAQQGSEELFINTVTKTLERKNSKEQEVQSGWFTPEEMAHTLGWKDKYSDKMDRYYVRGSAELQLRGEFLPLGFLAVKPDEEDEAVEDMSSLDAAARKQHFRL
eukprot:s906_g8.t1